ncbi:hypothetical protein CYY_004613 [Polysphondylium violaceum]|uniref:Uncharacterized protein n=1 Tax=Polysphondylium violaceum TaxID=133409 RepID=A0A8J4V7L7_9MYCE|nr:hypothetical protein CYY_004613 [Polysphondylium violaceum]
MSTVSAEIKRFENTSFIAWYPLPGILCEDSHAFETLLPTTYVTTINKEGAGGPDVPGNTYDPNGRPFDILFSFENFIASLPRDVGQPYYPLGHQRCPPFYSFYGQPNPILTNPNPHPMVFNPQAELFNPRLDDNIPSSVNPTRVEGVPQPGPVAPVRFSIVPYNMRGAAGPAEPPKRSPPPPAIKVNQTTTPQPTKNPSSSTK